MRADLSPAERRRAIFALALAASRTPSQTTAHVVDLADGAPGALASWSELCLLVNDTELDSERLIDAAVAAGPILDRLVPLPAAPGFTVTVDPATMPLYLGRGAR
ncbi:hypothetical protein [Parafrankia sp. FMc2]|uniref:hypothetical protein n=1 Tax=Parafrankia sp. FMc2 TaxID=3233196 RepID=UPI0034D6A6EB